MDSLSTIVAIQQVIPRASARSSCGFADAQFRPPFKTVTRSSSNITYAPLNVPRSPPGTALDIMRPGAGARDPGNARISARLRESRFEPPGDNPILLAEGGEPSPELAGEPTHVGHEPRSEFRFNSVLRDRHHDEIWKGP